MLSFFRPKARPAEPPPQLGKRAAADAAADVSLADAPHAPKLSPAGGPQTDAGPAPAAPRPPRPSPGPGKRQKVKQAPLSWARPGGCAAPLAAKSGARHASPGGAAAGAPDGAGAGSSRDGGAGSAEGSGGAATNGVGGHCAGGSRSGGVSVKREQAYLNLASDSDEDMGGPGGYRDNGAGEIKVEESKGPLGREGAMQALLAMGFSELQAGRALAHTQGDVSRAAEWIFQN